MWESHLQNSKADTGGYRLKNLRIGVKISVFPLYLSTFSLEVAWRLYMNDFLFQPMMMPSGQLPGGQTRKKTLRQWSRDPWMTWWKSGNGECSFLYNTALEVGVFLLGSQVTIREVLSIIYARKQWLYGGIKRQALFFSLVFLLFTVKALQLKEKNAVVKSWLRLVFCGSSFPLLILHFTDLW